MTALARYVAGSLSPTDDRAWTRGSVVMMDPNAVGPDSALKIATVWRAVNVLAAGLAVLPMNLFEQLYDDEGEARGKAVLRDDPRRRLVRRRPNRIQTSYRWRHQMMGRAVTGGNYYARKIARPGRAPDQLWPLEPERMRPTDIAGDGTLRYEYTKLDGSPETLTQDDLVHFRGFSSDGVVGISVFELMRQTTQLALMNRSRRTNFVRNEMRPSVVFKHPRALGDKARDNLQRGYRRAFGGPTKAGEVLVIEEGMEVFSFQISSKDSQEIESEHFLVEEFLRYTGVPGVLVGHADKTATYASAEQFFQSFVDTGIYPWSKNLEEELDFSLLEEQEDDLFFQLNLNALLRPDSAARSAFYRVMVEMGILTRNEVRELENRNPLPGLDEPLTPKNMGGAEPAPAGPTAPPPRPPAAPPAEEDEDEAARVWSARATLILDRAAARVVRKEVSGLESLARRYAGDPPGWREQVDAFYGRHRGLVMDALALDLEAATAYVDAQRAAVLAEGVQILESWSRVRPGDLSRLARFGVAAAIASQQSRSLEGGRANA